MALQGTSWGFKETNTVLFVFEHGGHPKDGIPSIPGGIVGDAPEMAGRPFDLKGSQRRCRSIFHRKDETLHTPYNIGQSVPS